MPQMGVGPNMARTMVEDGHIVKGLASRVWLGSAGSVLVFCQRLRLGPCLRRWGHAKRTTAGVSLDGRARHGAIRTEHATVARQRLQALSASFAVVEELARVRRHGFGRPMSTPRTGQCRFRNQARLSIHRLQPELASNISTMALFRMASRPFAEMCHRTRRVLAFRFCRPASNQPHCPAIARSVL
jgi:hypothetical protein